MDQIVSIPLPDPAVDHDPSPVPGGDRSGRTLPFVVGPENRLVELAVFAVLEDPTAAYNPLVIAGESGLGKSHLVQGLAAAYRVKYPGRPVVCEPALDFARQWTDALQCQATDRFRRRYHAARLLILEDVTRLDNKEPAQETLTPLLDAAVLAGHQVVVTAASPPGRWARISGALQSRLEAGLCVRLVPPGSDARAAILRQAAAQRGLAVGDAVIRILAGALDGSVRDLLGALVHLQAAAQIHGRPIDADMARTYVGQQRARASVELRDVAAAVARVFSLPVGQLRGRSQRQEVVSARGAAMYLSRQLTELTLEEIGQYFGGRDHTTVLHHCRKTSQLLGSEPSVEKMLEQVQDLLHAKGACPDKRVAAGVS